MQIGHVTSVKNYDESGRIEVIFLDSSQPFPVWVVGHIDRKPVEGDQVLVGFIQGRHDAPYLHSFIKNESYTSNFIRVEKDRIILQMPLDDNDAKAHLPEDKRATRPYLELNSQAAMLNLGDIQISVTKDGKIHLGGGGLALARVGDSVSVNVPGIGTCSGTITSGSSVVDSI
jgi:hypothetical protein